MYISLLLCWPPTACYYCYNYPCISFIHKKFVFLFSSTLIAETWNHFLMIYLWCRNVWKSILSVTYQQKIDRLDQELSSVGNKNTILALPFFKVLYIVSNTDVILYRTIICKTEIGLYSKLPLFIIQHYKFH